MLRTTAATLLLACSSASPALAQSPPVPGELEKVTEQFLVHFRDGNLEGLAVLFAADASYTPIVGPARLNGRDAIRGYYARVFAGSTSRSITPQAVRWQRYGDVMIRSADARIDQELKSGGKASTTARITFVYAMQDGRWTIVHHHSSQQPSPPKPAGG
jgi:uncharacterized protein (TIGR02246 family)